MKRDSVGASRSQKKEPGPTPPLALCLATTYVLVAAQDAPFILGVNGHPLVQEGYRPSRSTGSLSCSVTRAGWYRTDWGIRLDFSHHDALVDAAEAKGIRLLPVLSPTCRREGGHP